MAKTEAQRQWRLRNIEHVRTYNREWMRRNPERSRQAQKRYRHKLGKVGLWQQRVQKVYGLDDAAVMALYTKQGGLCAACVQGPAEVVDHDHKTKRVRGLLCNACNLGIGWLGDDPERLRLALVYLNRA